MKLGKSNRFFYYTRTGAGSFMMNPCLFFKEDLNLSEFRDAANRAIALYPELSVRTVIRNGIPEAVEDDDPVAFYPDNEKAYNVGSDDTNGHLFFFRYGKDYVKLILYHGMTDYKGLMTYLRTVILYYAENIHADMNEIDREGLFSQIRTGIDDISAMDEEDMWDPYSKHGNSDSVSSYTYDYPEALGITSPLFEPEALYVHHHLLQLNKYDFINKTKELGVSFVPLLVDVISGSILRKYRNGNLPVVAMVPADCRSFFGSRTLVNFSDGMMFPYYPENEDLSVSERCALFKDFMIKQRTKENFEKILGDKVRDTINFEKTDILAPAKKSSDSTPPVRRITYALTYPGNLDMGYGLDEIIRDQFLQVYVTAFATIVYTYKENMRILIIQRSDDPGLAECIQDGFRKLGFETTLTDEGRYTGDMVRLSELRKEI